MTCTVAAIIALLGYMPPRGTVITAPKAAIEQSTAVQLFKAKLCARRHGIIWKVE